MPNWIATETLYVGTAAAHQPGDVVPDDNVERNGWKDGVAREGSKSAKDASSPDEPLPVAAQAPAPK